MKEKRNQGEQGEKQNKDMYETAVGNGILTEEIGRTFNGNWTMYQGSQGHGFAAEKLNHELDRLMLKEAEIIGGDNAKNGADRLVNGEMIQTKFYKTSAGCIDACFDSETKMFKYLLKNGSPMTIEIPSDKYDEALRILQKRIQEGRVPGVSNPDQASKILKKSFFTYDQALNVSKSGTYESVAYDVYTSLGAAGIVGGITGAITFTKEMISGNDLKGSSKKAAKTFVKAGSKQLATSVIAGQIARTTVASTTKKAIETSLLNNSKNLLGKEISKKNANILGKQITGFASAGVALCVVELGISLKKYACGELDEEELLEELGAKGSGIVGGEIGGMMGAVIGTVILPGIGSMIGTLVGSIGGYVVSHGIYNNTLQLLKEEKLSKERREFITELSKAIRREAELERVKLEKVLNETLTEKREIIGKNLMLLENSIFSNNLENFQNAIESLGKSYMLELKYKNLEEFDIVMTSEEEKLIF